MTVICTNTLAFVHTCAHAPPFNGLDLRLSWIGKSLFLTMSGICALCLFLSFVNIHVTCI